jgi:DnaJ-class molecular chaperone
MAHSKCSKCNGTGKIYLFNPHGQDTAVTCSKCGGSGKKYRPK